jgi:Flp pilus assembly pilin Flp
VVEVAEVVEDREPSQVGVTGQEGQGLVEYGLVLLLVSIAAFGVLGTIGGTLAQLYLGLVASTFP